jgi:hypothetical protein
MKIPGPARRAADGTLVEPAVVDVMVGMFQRERAFICMDVLKACMQSNFP